jgi:hypothetical protein
MMSSAEAETGSTVTITSNAVGLPAVKNEALHRHSIKFLTPLNRQGIRAA